jgi:tRNA-splicing ligase RtcB
MARLPLIARFAQGREAHYFAPESVFKDPALETIVASFASTQDLESPLVVLPDVSHKADRISPTGMTLATRGTIVPAALPAANGSGVRVAVFELAAKDLGPDRLDRFLPLLAGRVPIYGEDSPSLIRGRLRESDLFEIYRGGARWLNERLGLDEDLERIESGGCLPLEMDALGELPRLLPDYFVEQGLYDFGILESGNHFIELQTIERIEAPPAAERHGLFEGQLVLMVHDGSPASLVAQYFQPRPYAKAREARRFEADKQAYHARFGEDASRYQAPASPWLAIEPDTPAHARFLTLMGCACNFGLANRAWLQHVVTTLLAELLGRPRLAGRILTDTLHDCVKRTRVGERELMVHRHGASEARPAESYPEGHPFARTGQLVGIPGAPGRASYLVAARDTRRTHYTANHGAGRRVDRSLARTRFDERATLEAVRASGARLLRSGLGRFAGENPAAYKDVDDVLSLASQAGLVEPVARLRPLAIYKG